MPLVDHRLRSIGVFGDGAQVCVREIAVFSFGGGPGYVVALLLTSRAEPNEANSVLIDVLPSVTAVCGLA